MTGSPGDAHDRRATHYSVNSKTAAVDAGVGAREKAPSPSLPLGATTVSGANGRVCSTAVPVPAAAAGMTIPVVEAWGRGVPAVREAAGRGGGSQSR